MNAPQHSSHLQWVFIDNKLTYISEFAHLKASKRPPALCPVCSRPVTMKLGPERIDHFAHQPGDECATLHPETALHINAKYHIYRELRSMRTRSLTAQDHCRTCRATRDYVLLANWDDVEVEKRIEVQRPDLVLVKNGLSIGAIEVFVTHPTARDKAEYLHLLGIPVIEVLGIAVLPLESAAWCSEQPLPVHWQYPERAQWQCDGCVRRNASQKRITEALQKRKAREQEYKKHNSVKVLRIKIVDFFYPSGGKYRELFLIEHRIRNDQEVELWLKKGIWLDKRTVLAHEDAPITQESKERLNEAYLRLLDEQEKRGAIVDSAAMQWQEGWSPHLHSKMIFADTWFPRRYRWEKDRWEMPAENANLDWNGFWDDYSNYQPHPHNVDSMARQEIDKIDREIEQYQQYCIKRMAERRNFR